MILERIVPSQLLAITLDDMQTVTNIVKSLRVAFFGGIFCHSERTSSSSEYADVYLTVGGLDFQVLPLLGFKC